MSITYRIANILDTEELYALSIQFTEYNVQSTGLREKFFWADWEIGFREEIIECLMDPDSHYFVAVDEAPEGNRIIGYILGRKFDKGYYYSIEELFVVPEQRKNSVGKQLLKMAIEQGRTYSMPVRVEIYHWNEFAKGFYIKNGFKEDSVVLEYTGN